MTLAGFARLIALAAIWGASFLFMRIGVPVLGPVVLLEARVALAALFLLAVGVVLKKQFYVRAHWKHFLLLGFINSALPFLLFGIAAQTLSASLLSVLNATAPIWGAVMGAIWSRKALGARSALGLVVGVVGVAVLVGLDPSMLQEGAYVAILIALGAPLCYGISSTYAKSASKVDAFANAHGSMWAAALIVAPAVPFFVGAAVPGPGILAAVLALGVVCSGVAYLLYFRLIDEVGPTSALTVTFLIPVFGVLWGHLFLGEPVGLNTLVGACCVLAGTALVTGFSPGTLVRPK